MIKPANLSRLLASMAVAAVLALPAGPAFAAASNGDYVGKTEAEITENLVKQGYKVGEFEMEDGRLEAKVIMDGKPYDIPGPVRSSKSKKAAKTMKTKARSSKGCLELVKAIKNDGGGGTSMIPLSQDRFLAVAAETQHAVR